MSRETRARLGYLFGVLLVALGAGWQLGPGWGVAVFGMGVMASFVWLYRVDEDVEDDPPPDDLELKRMRGLMP